MERLEYEHDNLHAAVAGALVHDRAGPGSGQRVVRLLDESLALYRGGSDRTALPTLLTGVGSAACAQGRFADPDANLEEPIALGHTLQQDGALPKAYWILGRAHAYEGHLERAVELLEEGIAIARRIGDEHYGAMADTLNSSKSPGSVRRAVHSALNACSPCGRLARR